MDGKSTCELIRRFPLYSVTRDGVVFRNSTGTPVEQFLWGDYLAVRLIMHRGKSRTRHVHRLVAQAFVPNPSLHPVVNHVDGNKLNNRAENLCWVTRSENQRHAIQLGLRRTKIPPADRIAIRERYLSQSPPVTLRQLANEFGVSPSCISRIVKP